MNFQEAMIWARQNPGRSVRPENGKYSVHWDNDHAVAIRDDQVEIHTSLTTNFALDATWHIVETDDERIRREHGELVDMVRRLIHAERNEHLIVRLNDSENKAVEDMKKFLANYDF